MSSFNRAYILKATKGTQEITIQPPFRLQFQCNKSTEGDALNKLQCTVYGLKESTRGIFQRDDDADSLVKIELSVGYDGTIKRLFIGDLHRGGSGLTSNGFVTSFESQDGGHDYLNSYTATTVSGKENAIDAIISDMPNTTKGKITAAPELVRPKVLMGASSKLIEDLTGDGESFYIDEGKINIVKSDEVVSNYTPVVSPETGLITTPEVEGLKRTFETMLNPFIILGGKLSLQSSIDPKANGVCKVTSIAYNGDTEGQDWKQSVTCVLLPNFKVI